MSQHPEYDRLAGLDALIIQFTTDTSSTASAAPYSTTAIDGVPYVMIPTETDLKARFPVRAGRSPLSDKSRDVNAGSSNTPVFPNRKRPVNLDRVNTKEEHSPCCRALCPPSPNFRSFHLLPPVSLTSALCLPSIFENSVQCSSPSSQADCPPPSSSPRSTQLLSCPLHPTTPRGNPIHNAEHSNDAPAFTHPNSPYVPWATPVRQEILRPITPTSHASALSGCYSRPYSRSGARAPEPTEHECQQVGHGATSKASRSWKSFRQVLKNSARHAIKRIGYIRKSTRTNHISPIPDRSRSQPDEQSIWEGFTPVSPPLLSPSAASVQSTETTSLEAWLAARRRDSLEQGCHEEVRMTLDEYEQMGSWLDVREQATDIESTNDDQFSPVYSPGIISFTGEFSASTDNRESVLLALEQLDLLSLQATSSHCIHNQSSPELSESPHRNLRNSEISNRLSFTRSVPGTSIPHPKGTWGREMSMPGGWNFDF